MEHTFGQKENIDCIFCREPIYKQSYTCGDRFRRDEYTCPNCGTYSLGNNRYQVDDIRIIQSMYYYLLNEKPQNADIIVLSQNETTTTTDEGDRRVHYISDDDVLKYYPSNFSQQIDKALLNLSKVFPDYDNEISFKSSGVMSEVEKLLPTAEKIRDLVFVEGRLLANRLPSMQRLTGFLTLMVDMGYLKHIPTSDSNTYRISSKGWLRVQEMQQSVRKSGKVFVAMRFASNTDKTWNSIRRAISKCGYTSVRIDKKEHNNQIVPEILYEINQSEFIIADLTGNNNGVYYEAGYAQALGKEVIVIWRKSDESEEQPHFDLAQKNMIRWSDEEQLCRDLVKRIEATVGMR